MALESSVESSCLIAFEESNYQEATRLLSLVKEPKVLRTTIGDYWLIHLAVKNGWLDVVKDLITEHGCDPMVADNNGNTCLHLAVWNNHIDIVKYLITEHDCDPMVANTDGYICLHLAVWNSHIDIVKYLITEHGCDPMVANKYGNTCLNLAVWNNHIDIVKYLITEHGCDPMVANNNGNMCLHLAVKKHHIDIVKYLITEHGCDPMVANNDGNTCLHFAVKKNHIDIVKYLITEHGCDPMVANYNGNTCLHVAVWNNHIDIVKYLITEHSCDPMVANYNGNTCLRLAVKKNHIDIVKYLITEHGCDPMVANKYGYTCLHLAVWNNHIDIIKYLITEHDCNPKVAYGNTCLHLAVWNNHIDIVKYLITEHGCDPMVANKYGNMCLHLAVWNNHIDIVKYLITEHGCNPKVAYGNTCLHLAVWNNHIDIVKYLITEHGCDPMVANKYGNTCLHLAVKKNHIDIIKYLITEHGCNPKVAYGNTCLHLAVWNNHIDIVKYLITEHDCDPMVANNDGNTCLHLAFSNNHIDIVKYLITEHDCDPMVANNDGNTCLHLAFSNNHIDIVKYLITEHGCNPKVAYGNTCLHLAVWNNHIDIVKYLITEHGCDPMVANYNGNTCLHVAVWNNHIDIVKYLITEHGCDPMVANYNGNTCLHVAVSNNHIDIVKYLITEHDCDPMVANKYGNMCLHLAVWNNHIDIIKYLITEHGCDPMVANYNGNTCLHVAVSNNHIDIVKYLITEHGCDPMVANNDGNTCLHVAVSNNHTDIVKYLIIEHGCDPMVANYNGNTCLHVAVWNNHIDIVKYLITEHGCDPMVVNKMGRTLLHIAVQNQHLAIIECLLSTGKVNPLAKDIDNMTPVKLAMNDEDMNDEDIQIQFIFTKFGKIKTSHPVDSYVNVLLLGNPGAGKSTLAGVITDRREGGFWGGRFRYVKDVQLYTAGIIPTKLQHKELGNIILHDFAGHSEYYSSHTAVIENLLQGSGAVFIIVVDITSEDSFKHLQQWLTIVNNEVHKCISQCHIIVAASHIDEVTDITIKNEKMKKLSKIIEKRCHSQVTLLSLDCRKLGGGNMNSLFNELSSSCQSICNTSGRNSSLYCHMMYGFLEESQQNILSLTDIINSPLKDEYILPKEREDILEILSSLHSIGLICLLKSQEDIDKVWVIVNKQILLAEVNGIFFAPEFFEQYCNIASNTGIITSSSLIHLFPDYNIEVLICFFINMALCQEINLQFLKETNLSSRDITAQPEATPLFFPALLDIEKPIDINGKVFKFGLCLQCTQVYHFFPSRFFHILTLHLAYKYGLPDSSSSFNRQCTFWRNGVHFNRDGVETLVEMVDDSQSVLVLMSFVEMCETKMISLRRRIIKEVMDVQKESYPSLMVLAYVIDSDELTYPIDKPTQRRVYKVADISECITNGREYVNSTPHSGDSCRILKQKKIKDLLNNECTTDVSKLSILGKDAPVEEEDNGSLTKNVTNTSVTKVTSEMEGSPVDYSTNISSIPEGHDSNPDDKPRLVDLMNILTVIAHQYSIIGIALNVPDLGLHPLPQYYIENLSRTLQWWLDNGNSVGSPVTFDTLIEAIEGPIVQNYEIAQEIRKLKDN